MAGGAMGVTNTAENTNATGGMGGGNTGTTTQETYTPSASAGSYYASLAQPGTPNTTALLNSIYQQSLGRAPDTEGANYWANAAKAGGWDAQKLAEAVNAAGATERERTGYTSTLNPYAYGAQKVGATATAPSYYNTNPFSVDYANIFNPYAKSVVSANPAMSPGQQAQYLQNWQADYNNRINSGVEAAKAAQIAESRRAQDAYTAAKAKAEAESKANTQAAIDKAVQEALAQQQQGFYTAPFNPDAYQGAGKSGGIASLAKGFKK